MDYAKNTPLVPTSASICKESHQNEFAAVKTITDDEKWQPDYAEIDPCAHL